MAEGRRKCKQCLTIFDYSLIKWNFALVFKYVLPEQYVIMEVYPAKTQILVGTNFRDYYRLLSGAPKNWCPLGTG